MSCLQKIHSIDYHVIQNFVDTLNNSKVNSISSGNILWCNLKLITPFQCYFDKKNYLCHLMHISYCYQYIHLFHRVWTSFFLQFCTRDHLCFGGLRYHHCLLLQFHLGRYGFGTGVVQKHKFYFVWLHFSIILNR